MAVQDLPTAASVLPSTISAKSPTIQRLPLPANQRMATVPATLVWGSEIIVLSASFAEREEAGCPRLCKLHSLKLTGPLVLSGRTIATRIAHLVR